MPMVKMARFAGPTAHRPVSARGSRVMSANSDRTFQPRLESFEARCLPSMVPFLFQLLHARLRPQVLPPTSPVVRAAAVRNIFNPALVATFPTSLAAHGTAPAGGLNLTTSI